MVKAFVVNIHRDHDIQSFRAEELVAKALEFLGDPTNSRRCISHVLYATQSTDESKRVLRTGENERMGLRWLQGDFENPARPGVHAAVRATKAILDAYEENLVQFDEELDIYIDLNQRSLALGSIIQEFSELPWHKHFRKVRLKFNNVVPPKTGLPPHLEIDSSRSDDDFSEVSELVGWAHKSRSRYLATLTGDGEYRLADILLGVSILKSQSFGAIYGSRNQSRRQFVNSLDAAYGESKYLYFLSWLGVFCSPCSSVCATRLSSPIR